MTIEFRALPGVLTNPTQTFEKLKKGANFADGMMLLLIVAAISGVISFLVNLLTLPMVAKLPGYQASMAGNTVVMAIISLVLGIVLNVVLFLAISWLSNKFASAISGKKGDLGKTVGLFGYTDAAFSIIGIPLGTVFGIAMVMSIGPNVALLSILGIIYFLVMLGLVVWEWLVAGRAVATATGATWGAGILGVFLAGLVIAAFAIVFAILMVGTMLMGGMMGRGF